MSLTIEITEPFAKEWQRVVTEEISSTVQVLEKAHTENEKHEAVHEARKSFKKIRAALRLLRDEASFYKKENRFFRDLGRELSEVRDATSRLETLRELHKNYEAKIYKNAFSSLQTALVNHRQQLCQNLFEQNDLLDSIAERLKAKEAEVQAWPLEINSFDKLKPSLKRVYKRGKKAQATCENAGRPEDFHEWRKRAKYLRYQFRMLYQAWPGVLQAVEDDLHTLTDWIGEDHDLEVLKKWIKEQGFSFENTEEQQLFEALTSHRQQNLKTKTIWQGQRCYYRSPSSFVNRMEFNWKTALELKEVME